MHFWEKSLLSQEKLKKIKIDYTMYINDLIERERLLNSFEVFFVSIFVLFLIYVKLEEIWLLELLVKQFLHYVLP